MTYLSKMENGKQSGSERVLRSLADALDVPAIQLLDLAGKVPDEVRVATGSDAPAAPRSLTPPRYATRFFNRSEQVGHFHRVWRPEGQQGALVTVTGPAGCGKSRLAAELATGLISEGVVVRWLSVRELDDAERMAAELAAGDADTSSLVVLDDADLALAASRDIARRLLASGTGVSVLATSRRQLDLYGEFRLPLTGLPVPDKHLRPDPAHGLKPDLQRLQTHESVNLFVDRAGLVAPGFQLDRTNAAAVFDVCLWLDGLPLAIELAALRLRQMSVVDLAAELGDLLTWLDGNTIDSPGRHKSLHTAIDWSFQQLSAEHRTVAARLCSFSASFRRADAVEVASDEALPQAMVTAALRELVDCSLLLKEEDHDGRAVYRWPHPIRQFGRQLERGPDAAKTRERYASWCWRVVQSLRNRPARSEAEWARLADLTPDLFAAVHRLPAEDQKEAMSLLTGEAASVLEFGHPDGQWLVARLSTGSVGPMDVFRERGILARVHGKFDRAKELLQRALQGAENERDQQGQADTLLDLAENAIDQEDYEEAEVFAARANELYVKLKNQGGIAEVKNLIGKIKLGRNDPAGAALLFEEALELAKPEEDRRREAYSLQNLGISDFSLGRIARARDRLEQSLGIRQHMQNLRGAARVIEAFALVESAIENHAVALMLLGAAQQYRRSSEMQGISPWWRAHLDGIVEHAKVALAATPDETEQRLRLGAAMSLEDAGALAVRAMKGTFREPLEGPISAPMCRPAPAGETTAVAATRSARDDAPGHLDRILAELAAGGGSPSEVLRRLHDSVLLALGEPLADGTTDLLSFAPTPGLHRGMIVPVFTGQASLDEVLRLRPEWKEKPVVSVRFDQLRDSLISGETVIVNPWLPSEYRFSAVEQGFSPAPAVQDPPNRQRPKPDKAA